MKTGTLKELNVKPGDVVECVKECDTFFFGVGMKYEAYKGDQEGKCEVNGVSRGIYDGRCTAKFRIVSRAAETPKLWRDMTPEEKGALLLAHHEGR